MGLKLVGGPYDGMEIDQALIAKHAQPPWGWFPVNGDVGLRLFLGMPDKPKVWQRMVRGEDVKPGKVFLYERVFGPGGTIYVHSPAGWGQALSQAKLKLHSRAKIALDALTPEDRRRVLEAADELQHQSPEEWPQDKIKPLGEDKQLYLLRVPPELRAFIRIGAKGQIEVVDLFREETLQWFMERSRAVVAPK